MYHQLRRSGARLTRRGLTFGDGGRPRSSLVGAWVAQTSALRCFLALAAAVKRLDLRTCVDVVRVARFWGGPLGAFGWLPSVWVRLVPFLGPVGVPGFSLSGFKGFGFRLPRSLSASGSDSMGSVFRVPWSLSALGSRKTSLLGVCPGVKPQDIGIWPGFGGGGQVSVCVLAVTGSDDWDSHDGNSVLA
jgi:hypothetical protein